MTSQGQQHAVAAFNLLETDKKKKKRRKESIALESDHLGIEGAAITFILFLWQHFGYPLEFKNSNRVTGKTQAVCKRCKEKLPYAT